MRENLFIAAIEAHPFQVNASFCPHFSDYLVYLIPTQLILALERMAQDNIVKLCKFLCLIGFDDNGPAIGMMQVRNMWSEI